MLTKQSIDDFVDHLTLTGASHETIRAYRTDLTIAAVAIPACTAWSETERALAAYLNDTRGNVAPKTTQRRLTTFRSWAKFNGRSFLTDYRPPVAAPSQPHPIPEGIDGVKAMIMSSRNYRHRALCTMQGLMGLRVSEAVAIVADDFDLPNGVLRVRGKGDKVRYVPISDAAWKHLKRAYELAATDGGTLVGIKNRGARAAISRHGRNAGLERHVASHDLRATLATAAYEKTLDLRAVQEILGHADPKTTQKYTGVSLAARRAAMEVA